MKEIIIKLPDGIYNEIQRRGNANIFLKDVTIAIRNGIVLPEVHGDIKDVSTFSDEGVLPYDPGALNTLWNSIDNAPVLVPATKEGE